ncbi:probable ATP-dependent RNA helicase DDX20 [Maniola jurtina]|uniref:probable ATP-dependent RNA helicase DDX20 n=1 Tax=Maniola jurtina TaxID=191418 RepID=UPI001E68CE65|nr:probable ATP-dependent RNA helicase DDX20 [Maniola jurtina]
MVLAHDLQESKKTNDIEISQDVTFDTMLLSSNTLEGLKKSGFIRPSPIQLHGVPLGKCGFDLLLEAKSGTGKTAVFTIIILEKLDLDKGLQAVILAPTREIAAQVCDVLRQIGNQYTGLRVEVVMGGLPVQEDIEKFKENNVHIVVASPGRLKHLIKGQHIDIGAVRLLVLDEADKLMEKSFLPDIKYIHKALPLEKQVIMSSATFPESCKEFINEFVHDAQHICPNSDCVLLGVVQKVTYVKYNSNSVIQTNNRFKELLKIIRTKQFKQCLIFCNYQTRVGELYKMLTREKWPAEQLYGAQDQLDRLDALKTLQDYKCRILISTDLAARGIDALNVDLVINFEPPFEWQTYLHRIGRAGRFGSYGMAITILSEGSDQKKFMDLLSAVNLSVKLTPLWPEVKSNGEHAQVSEAENYLALKDTDEQGSTELWKIICGAENSPNKENIENFYELFNSFQNTANETCDIESFSDLFNSFQNNNLPDTNGFQYKCMKWPNLSTKQYLIGVKNKLKDLAHETNDSLTEFANNLNGSRETICGKYKKQTEQRVENYSKINIQDSISEENNSKSVENNFETMKSVKTNANRLLPISSLNKKHEFSHNRKQIPSSSSNEDCKNGREKTSYKCRTKSKVRNTQLNKSSAPHSSISCSSDTSSDFYPTEENLFMSCYSDWYKKLKIRVRQIELAVYIDELSKL